MTTTQTTETSVQDFLSEAGAPTDPRHWLEAAYAATDPMAIVGAALCGLLGTVVESQNEEKHEAAVSSGELVSAEVFETVEAERRELEQLHEAKQAMIDEALAAMKKSTSKLANELRSILEPPAASGPAETPADPEQPPLPGTE